MKPIILDLKQELFNNIDLKKYKVIELTGGDLNAAYVCHLDGSCSQVKTIYMNKQHTDKFHREWSNTYKEAVTAQYFEKVKRVEAFEEVYGKYIEDRFFKESFRVTKKHLKGVLGSLSSLSVRKNIFDSIVNNNKKEQGK